MEPSRQGDRWVEQWRTDPEASFRRIFQHYYRPVFYFFAKRGFSPDECRDLAQDTFLRVHKGLPSFRRESRFDTWLFQIAANVYKNSLRGRAAQKREAHEVPLELEEPEPGTADGDAAGAVRGEEPLAGMLAKERLEVLREALQDLPSQMRRCVVLRIDHDLKYREIAAVMRVSIDTVKAHLFQARQQLKGRLAGYFANPDL